MRVTRRQIQQVLRADGTLSVLLGLLLLAGSWDGLYRGLDLPQARPALFVQFGGALLLAAAWLLFYAARRPEALARPVAAASAIAKGLMVVQIGAWLIGADLGIGTGGTILLAALAVVLALFAAVESQIYAGPDARGPDDLT